MADRLFEKKTFKLTNTLTGKREEFRPASSPRVLYYSCGPTVYGPLHIGNARALVVADFLYRWLKHAGYDVHFVRNYTDVDDKIIDRAKEEKISALEVAEKYIRYCEEDIQVLGLQPPVKTVRVTDSIPEIISMIEKIIARGFGYVVNGEVLYSIEKFESYGALSGKNTEDLEAGARVEVNSIKKNPLDFSLWKPHKPGEPFWESPWGPGRPGWHIECSAMVSKWLGDSIDIHHGGQDLIFPHHENEIAQSEAATGKTFCTHWVHHAFMTMGNEKMSKSLGNILTIRDFTKAYSAEVLKYIFISHHFRSMIDFSPELIERTISELERIYESKSWAQKTVSAKVAGSSEGAAWAELESKISKAWEKIEDEMLADLNSPGALGHVFPLIREINRLENQNHEASNAKTSCAQAWLDFLNLKLFPLWNVFGLDAVQALQKLEEAKHQLRVLQGASDSVSLSDSEIEEKITARIQARKDKNFKRADELRVELDQAGVIVIDSPSGTTWKKK